MKSLALFGGVLLASTLYCAERPNIIIVLADDMGWGDPQCYQADSKIPTPALNRLAEEGLKFTDAHTPSSVCTPTRYGLLTGRYSWRTRLKLGVLDGFDPPLIGSHEDTLATLLKRVGYQTHCIGKWHLGLVWPTLDGSTMKDRIVSKGFRPGLEVDYSQPFREGPLERGFDTFFGISASLDMSPYCYLRGDRVVEVPGEETEKNLDGMFMNQSAGVISPDFRLVDVLPRIAEETARIIRDSEGDPTPFFCYVPLNSPHLPVAPTGDSLGRSDAGPYGDFVVDTDEAVGEILRALDETGQAEDTLVVFTSDNGGLFHYWDFRASDDGGAAPKTARGEQIRHYGHQSNADWRGTKADVFEGGHRVPFLLRWPGRAAAGREVSAVVELTDLFATVEEVVGEDGRGDSGIDSLSLLPLIKGSGKANRAVSVHHSHRGMFAVRHGSWKLIEGRGSGGFTQPRFIEDSGPAGQLYNLETDPQETSNLYERNPEMVSTLKGLLQKVKEKGAAKAAKIRSP